MNELPDKVMLWHNCLPLTHIGQWATTRYPEDAEGYVKVSALGTMVKPLEWYTSSDNKEIIAPCELLSFYYKVEVYQEKYKLWLIQGRGLSGLGLHPTTESAKATAQRHYTNTILPAFGLVPK